MFQPNVFLAITNHSRNMNSEPCQNPRRVASEFHIVQRGWRRYTCVSWLGGGDQEPALIKLYWAEIQVVFRHLKIFWPHFIFLSWFLFLIFGPLAYKPTHFGSWSRVLLKKKARTGDGGTRCLFPAAGVAGFHLHVPQVLPGAGCLWELPSSQGFS